MAKRSFSSYQIQLEKIIKSEEKADQLIQKWESEIFQKLIEKIGKLKTPDRQIKFGNKVLLIDEYAKINSEKDLSEEVVDISGVSIDVKAIVGRMKFVEYGTVPNYYDVSKYTSRKSGKRKTEGEEKFFHFIVRLEDGFMLLQNDISFTRSKMDKYFSELYKNKLPTKPKKNFHNIGIINILKRGFFQELNELDAVSQVILEVKKEKERISGDENEFVKSQQEESKKLGGTHIQIVHKAKRSSFKKGNVVSYLKGYEGDKNITSVKVKGNQGDAEKTIDVNKYREKYVGEFETDPITNLVLSKDVYKYLYSVIQKRELLL